MIETTIEILTHYPCQTLIMAVVLCGTLRAGLEELAGGQKDARCRKPIETATPVV